MITQQQINDFLSLLENKKYNEAKELVDIISIEKLDHQLNQKLLDFLEVFKNDSYSQDVNQLLMEYLKGSLLQQVGGRQKIINELGLQEKVTQHQLFLQKLSPSVIIKWERLGSTPEDEIQYPSQRLENDQYRIDLSSYTIHGIKLIKMDLRISNFSKAEISFSSFTEIDWAMSIAVMSYFTEVSFCDIDFQRMDFSESTFLKTSFLKCDFTLSDWESVSMLSGLLDDCCFGQSKLKNLSVQETMFKNTVFKQASFKENKFNGCVFEKSVFTNCGFTNVVFENCQFIQCEGINEGIFLTLKKKGVKLIDCRFS